MIDRTLHHTAIEDEVLNRFKESCLAEQQIPDAVRINPAADSLLSQLNVKGSASRPTAA